MANDIQAHIIPNAVAPVAGARISYEDFLNAYDGTHAEWIDGKIVTMSPASKQHQRLVVFLTRLMSQFIESRQVGELFVAPFQMKTGDDFPGREPDILFVANENHDRVRNTHVAGPADLVVEIASPDSLVRDRGEKFSEYERGGVREYWLIDPLRKVADFYRLDGEVYRPAIIDQDGRYQSAVLASFWLRVDWLWQDPPPPLMNAFKELGLVP